MSKYSRAETEETRYPSEIPEDGQDSALKGHKIKAARRIFDPGTSRTSEMPRRLISHPSGTYSELTIRLERGYLTDRRHSHQNPQLARLHTEGGRIQEKYSRSRENIRKQVYLCLARRWKRKWTVHKLCQGECPTSDPNPFVFRWASSGVPSGVVCL